MCLYKGQAYLVNFMKSRYFAHKRGMVKCEEILIKRRFENCMMSCVGKIGTILGEISRKRDVREALTHDSLSREVW